MWYPAWADTLTIKKTSLKQLGKFQNKLDIK